MIDMLIGLIHSIFTFLKRLYLHDRVAFLIGVVFLIAGSMFITFLRPLFWLIVVSYFTGLAVAERRGEKLDIAKSFRKATSTIKNTSHSKGKESEPSLPPSGGVTAPEDKEDKNIEKGNESDLTDKSDDTPGTPGKQGIATKIITFTGAFLSDDENVAQETVNIKNVELALKQTIRGQDHAINAVVSTLKRALAGLKTKKEKPLCVFLFLGATGTGKTELVKQIALATGRPLIRFDMPNYNNEAGVWELIGSPPGYVGSDKPGRLTGEIRDNPNSVLLLDEIEKATPKIWDPFLRVLDEGKMKDQSQGFTANFSNVLIFLTSNLLQHDDFIEDEKELRNKVLREGYFRPELLNRIDSIVMFRRFDLNTMKEIVQNMLQRFMENFIYTNKLNTHVSIDRAVIEHIIKNIDLKYGVRDAQRFVEKNLGDALADAYISHDSGSQVSEINVYVKSGSIAVELKEV